MVFKNNQFENMDDKEIAELVCKEFDHVGIDYKLNSDNPGVLFVGRLVWVVSWYNYYEGANSKVFINKETALEFYRSKYKHVDAIHIEESEIVED